MIKSSNRPHINVADIYTLNTQITMLFLHQNGLHAKTFDVRSLKSHVGGLEKQLIEYKCAGPRTEETQAGDGPDLEKRGIPSKDGAIPDWHVQPSSPTRLDLDQQASSEKLIKHNDDNF
jgi:hypothetical protein